VTTPLADPDPGAVAAFWSRATAAGAVPADTPPPGAEPFGDSLELADELLALVLAGTKRATAGSFDEYQREGSPLPRPGGLSIATDGAGVPRAVLRTTEVRVGPLSSVDDAFAWDEGEGDRTRASWLADHEAFFRRWLPEVGLEFSPDMPTVFERFDVVYAEPGALLDTAHL
jgi:uncharacterized protein YhfF